MPLSDMISDMINEMPMFESFSDQEKQMFTEMKHSIVGFKNGETIINEGDECTSMFLIIKGACLITKTQDDTTIRLAKIKAGELFGEMSFFTRNPRQTSVIASDDVMVMKMDDDFFEKVDSDVRDKIKNCFIELLIKRLNAMNASIMRTSKLMHA